MTETGGVHSGPGRDSNRVLPPEHAGSFGMALPGIERRIVDIVTRVPLPDESEGEICVRGYNLMMGFYKRERHEIFDDDGWYPTGDLGYLKDDLLFFKGRIGDMIKTKGANVAPGEVEKVLTSHYGVEAAAVIGIPDIESGQVVVAAVVPTPNEDISDGQLIEYVRSKLSSYKVPKRILILPELPHTSTGKTDQQRLAQLLLEGA
jgi:acyl-CoA synthetase (AMP-forming)/AMP-acid ligase II